MEIKTKYNIGETLFWLDKRDGIYKIKYDSIKSINFGGKSFKRYEIGYTTRAERDIFEIFEDAKKEAIRLQKEWNKKTLEIIEETKLPTTIN